MEVVEVVYCIYIMAVHLQIMVLLLQTVVVVELRGAVLPVHPVELELLYYQD